MTNFYFSTDIEWIDPEDRELEGRRSRAPCLMFPHWVGSASSLEVEIVATSGQSSLEIFHEALPMLGVEVRRFSLELVSISDLAHEIGVSRETVRLWSTGDRRDGFPARFTHVGASQVWAWSEVHTWAKARGYLPGDGRVPVPVRELERANGQLAQALVGLS
jgi:DNA-binding transcriptional regulator YiaG